MNHTFSLYVEEGFNCYCYLLNLDYRFIEDQSIMKTLKKKKKERKNNEWKKKKLKKNSKKFKHRYSHQSTPIHD